MEHYDYIIAGAGCSGLSLLVHMIHSGKLRDKRILLVDRSPKTENDHTWCFWEQTPGLFEPVVSKRWSRLQFHSHEYSRTLEIEPYEYKMIRAADFYRYCFNLITSQPNVKETYGNIEAMETVGDKALLTISGQTISADYIFSSISLKPIIKQAGKYYLVQHFKGWMVEMERPVFDVHEATLMDFRIPQNAGTSFVYLLPVSPNKAMIEYTIFSANVLDDEEYDTMLAQYIDANYPDTNYQVIEAEQGRIPMTNHVYEPSDGRIIYLGTAAGRTKPSTGYTFKPVQLHSRRLVAQLLATGNPYLAQHAASDRFHFYDKILLGILSEEKLSGEQIFTRLFQRNTPQQVFRFLDDATSLREEIKLTLTLQKMPFLRAAFKELLKK